MYVKIKLFVNNNVIIFKIELLILLIFSLNKELIDFILLQNLQLLENS